MRTRDVTVASLLDRMKRMGHTPIKQKSLGDKAALLTLIPGTQILEAQCATCLQTAQYDAATKKVSGNAMTATCTHKGLTSREGRLMYYRTPSNAARR